MTALLMAGRPALSQATDWTLTLTAEMPGVRDQARVSIGAASGALEGLDPMDEPHPPRFPDRYLDLTVHHSRGEPGWEDQSIDVQRYLGDYQPSIGSSSRTVSLFLETDTRGPASLAWNRPVSPLLEAHDVFIEDVSENRRVNMRLQTFMDRTVDPGEHPFRIIFTYKDPALVTPTPTQFVFVSPTPSPVLTPAFTETPGQQPTSTPTPTATPPSFKRWWDLFEMAANWNETAYSGRVDFNEDGEVSEGDFFELYDAW